MAGNFGRKLYSSLWEAANPLFGRATRSTSSHFTYDAVTANTTQSSYGFTFKRQARNASSFSPQRTTQITKRFASGSFFALGFSPSSSAVDTGATCAIGTDKILPHRSYHLDRRFFRNLTASAWKRGLHTGKDDRRKAETPKDASFKTDNPRNESQNVRRSGDGGHEKISRTESTTTHGQQQQLGPFNRNFMDRLPHMTNLHRPSKEELLAAATGFWSRLKVRFKWFSIRSVRPYNFDEITALFSWVLLGHVVWVVVGTTTFFSLIILAINTVFAQGMFNGLSIRLQVEC